ncbi:MAG: hypothetical protein ACKO7N_01660 [Candidatus Nitrosotenuis sp.]
MNNFEPLIVWEKWVDPFGADNDEAKWRDYNNDIQDIHSDIEEDEDVEESQLPKATPPIKVIASPLGLIPYNEHTASSKIFNFWLGHTNFDINQPIKNLLNKADGVEILDIFTRYRFRIAIGKCFNDSETMTSINDTIYQYLNSYDES